MASVSSVTFHYVLKALERKTDISIQEMLDEVGLSFDDLQAKESIKSYKLSAIFRYSMQKTENANLALEIGDSIPYQSLGILGYLLLNAEDLKQMIEKFHRYQKLVSGHLKFNFSEDEQFYKFAIYINENRYIPIPSYHAQVHLSGILSILTKILGEKVTPAYTHFAHERQNEQEILQAIFGENISFEEEENAIYFKKDALNTPLKNSNPAMLSYFEAEANNILSLKEDSRWFSKIEKEILKNIGEHKISISFIASNLDLSVRTLQNYLNAESKSFSEALLNVRERLAKHYILKTKLDDTSISILLGYSEVSSFYRAFKKHNSITPKELRRRAEP